MDRNRQIVREAIVLWRSKYVKGAVLARQRTRTVKYLMPIRRTPVRVVDSSCKLNINARFRSSRCGPARASGHIGSRPTAYWACGPSTLARDQKLFFSSLLPLVSLDEGLGVGIKCAEPLVRRCVRIAGRIAPLHSHCRLSNNALRHRPRRRPYQALLPNPRCMGQHQLLARV